MAGATYLDISANPEVVKQVKKQTNLSLCVSSISVHDFYRCALQGVDVLEIGNYDFFYYNRLFLSQEHILNLAIEVRRLFPCLDICVTIPYSLSLDEQIQLSCRLEDIGIQILQTESLKLRLDGANSSLTTLLNIVLPVLSSTYAISKAVSIPIVAASGMNSVTALLAMLYGASGIGLGSSVMYYQKMLSRYIYIKEVIRSIQEGPITSSSNMVNSMISHDKILT